MEYRKPGSTALLQVVVMILSWIFPGNHVWSQDERSLQLFSVLEQARAKAQAGDAAQSVSNLRSYFAQGGKDISILYYDTLFDPVRKSAEFKTLFKELASDTVVTFTDIIRDLAAGSPEVTYVQKAILLPPHLFTYYSEDSIGTDIKMVRRYLPEDLSIMSGDTLLPFDNQNLSFVQCRFNSGANDFSQVSWSLGYLGLRAIVLLECKGILGLINCRLGVLSVVVSQSFSLKQSVLNGSLEVSGNSGNINFSDSRMQLSESSLSHNGGDLVFERCKVIGNGSSSDPDLKLYFVVPQLHIRKSAIRAKVLMNGRVEQDVRILGNSIEGELDFTRLRFPESDTELPFQQIHSAALVKWTEINDQFVRVDASDFSANTEINLDYYSGQMAILKRLYDVYRRRADLESANACYRRMKDLEILYLSSKSDRNWEEFMRLWINRTMGLYTNHATSPGKALVVSLFIILVFATLFMFYPSDWDAESKVKLLDGLRQLRASGNGQPRDWKVLLLALLSLANAFTLSLNAFVTLGFGNIPTSGFARYLCILEGALGWFLLTLFSVALLNQVLI